MSNVTGKAVKYGNIYYATIVSDAIDDFPIETVQTNILYPEFLVEDFFGIANGDTIAFTKNGYVKITFKASLQTLDGTLEMQIFKNALPVDNGRRQFKANGYMEASFHLPISAGDYVQIKVMGSVADMYFDLAAAVPDQLVLQKPYMLTLEFGESGNVQDMWANEWLYKTTIFSNEDPVYMANQGFLALNGSVYLKADYEGSLAKVPVGLIASSDATSITTKNFTGRYALVGNADGALLAEQLPSHNHGLTVATTDDFPRTHTFGESKADVATVGADFPVVQNVSFTNATGTLGLQGNTDTNNSGVYASGGKVRPASFNTLAYIFGGRKITAARSNK